MVLEKFKSFFNKKENMTDEKKDMQQTAETTETANAGLPAIDVYVDMTPNPNALKFIVNVPVKNSGNSTYRSPTECGENKLAKELFTVRGVDQLHIFENIITVSKFSYQDWSEVEDQIIEIIKTKMPEHDADYFDPDPEEERRRNLPQDLKDIEAVLDKTIRPGLQGDGGDIQTVKYENNVLLVKYQGACGTCPSAATGTLEAIRAILKDEYNPDIEVYIAPEF
jgi:Fe-S cluster biogenesis protein NfuA